MRIVKVLIASFLILGLATMLANPVSAMGKVPEKRSVAGAMGKETKVVVGEDDSTIDAQAVQDAVNNYDIVYLEDTFDFGDYNNVVITKDVVIVGRSNAKIKGGSATLSIGGDAQALFTPPTAHPKVTIKNIAFENPYWGAIFFIGSSGGSVENCEFTDGRLRDLPNELGPYLPPEEAEGLIPMCPYIYVGSFFHSTNPADISGNFSIKNNVMDGKVKVSDVPKPGYVYDPNYTEKYYTGASHGILLWLFNAQAVVSRNNVKNVPSSAIDVLDYTKNQLITGNTIDAGPIGWFTFGIFDARFAFFPSGPALTRPSHIENNIVKARNNAGIIMSQAISNVIAKENHITSDWAIAGMFVGVADHATDCLVYGNTIDGNGDFAIICDAAPEMGTGELPSENNVFIKNVLQNFSGLADMFFGPGSYNNTFVGEVDNTVLDLGTHNKVILSMTSIKGLSLDVKARIEKAQKDVRKFRGAMKQLWMSNKP